MNTAASKSSTPSNLVAPISPTPGAIIEYFLPLLNLKPDSLLIDLGCGDGRWLIAAHDRTKCKCLGVDVDEDRLKIAQDSIARNNLQEHVQVIRQDIFHFARESAEISKADVLIIFLARQGTTDMSKLLLNEQKRVQILSVGFAVPGWRPIHEQRVDGIRCYLYSTDELY